MSTSEDEGFDEEHPRDTDESREDEELLKGFLPFEKKGALTSPGCRVSLFEENHVDEDDEDGGGAVGSGNIPAQGSVVNPLVEDEEAEVEEEEEEEDDLRDELAEDVDVTTEVEVVPDREGHTEQHVQNPNDNRDLHFVPVEEGNLVLSQLPNRVNSDGVGVLVVAVLGVEHDVLHCKQTIVRHPRLVRVPVRAEDVEALAEDVVVYDSGVEGEDAHEENNVSAAEENVPDLCRESKS
jgi:hypothetical protein